MMEKGEVAGRRQTAWRRRRTLSQTARTRAAASEEGWDDASMTRGGGMSRYRDGMPRLSRGSVRARGRGRMDVERVRISARSSAWP